MNTKVAKYKMKDVKLIRTIKLKKRKHFDNYIKKVPSKFQSRYA